MSNTSAMLGLLTETSLHAGTGQMVGVIDLPIQREAHTDWPCIYGSGVKGSMRALAKSKENEWVNEVFGPEMTSGSEYAGALAVGDARLLLLPVRSLTSHFKWVTCPALLQRLQADCQRLQFADAEQFPAMPLFDKDEALVAAESAADSSLFLEEFRFTPQIYQQLDALIKMIAPLMGREDAELALQKQLTVVNDDAFSHLARYATPVNAHIAINNETKIVKPGALWYEETLPPDTLLYVALVAQPVRKAGVDKKAADVLGHIQALFDQTHPYIHLGGNETVGMGWCKVIFKTARLRPDSLHSHPSQSKSATVTDMKPKATTKLKATTKQKKPKAKLAANDDATTKSSFLGRWELPSGNGISRYS